MAIYLEGERVVVRDYGADDLEGLHGWMGDPDATHYLDFRSKNLEESARQLETCIAEQTKPNRDKYYLAIELRSTRQVIGGVGMELMRDGASEGGVADMGWFLQTAYWGHGYAADAARLLMSFGFTQLGLHRITAWCVAGNIASERVMQKCGMSKEACLRRHSFRAGEWRDRLLYAIMRHEWEASRCSGTASGVQGVS